MSLECYSGSCKDLNIAKYSEIIINLIKKKFGFTPHIDLLRCFENQGVNYKFRFSFMKRFLNYFF